MDKCCKAAKYTLVLVLACASGCSATLRCGLDSQLEKNEPELIGAANAT